MTKTGWPLLGCVLRWLAVRIYILREVRTGGITSSTSKKKKESASVGRVAIARRWGAPRPKGEKERRALTWT